MENGNINISGATYRLQFNERFTFGHFSGILDYLHQLGITTIYASPIFSAAPGSMHGYDVTDPHTIGPHIGTIEQFRELNKRMKELGITWLQDIVPNHMAFHMHNKRLADVLERGPYSPYYNFFDINWQHPDRLLTGKLMVPFLGKPFEETIAAGDIKMAATNSGFVFRCNGQEYPLSVSAYDMLVPVLNGQEEIRLQQLFHSLKDEDIITLPLKEWTGYKEKLFGLADDGLLQSLTGAMNNNKQLLADILYHQYYQFCHWQEADSKINYRRFFAVNELITLRMEDQQVFDEYHMFLHRLYRENLIQGLRIDHIDGLQEPGKYIDRLRALFGNNCYIIAEKVLEHNEVLPERWALQGSSGYEFLALVNQLLTDNAGVEKLSRYYRGQFPGLAMYPELVFSKKKLMLEKYMAGEWENLVQLAYNLKLAEGIDRKRFKGALALFMISLPVYRLYPQEWPPVAEDIAILSETMEKAKQKDRALESVLEAIQSWWDKPVNNPKFNASLLQYLKRIMQFTGPLMAKGVEDTVFYVYNALISHNEVGDTPGAVRDTPEVFHQQLSSRQYLFPQSLNATATHDTKRGEDARIRLNVLSAVPDLWIQQVQEWHTVNRDFITGDEKAPVPSVNDEYFIYQSLVAGYPASGEIDATFAERMCACFTKAVREGKVNSNWSKPDTAYEEGSLAFIHNILTSNGFKTRLKAFYGQIARMGEVHSLAQVLLKITAPGVPDIYQGCELWDLSFADPDNRRDVDYKLRQDYLAQLVQKENVHNQLALAAANSGKGMEKLYLTWKSLRFRKEHAAVFIDGDYIPLSTNRPANILAYARRSRHSWAIVVVPLMTSPAQEITEKDYVILADAAPSKWRNVYTGEICNVTNARLPLSVLQKFPVALLVNVF